MRRCRAPPAGTAVPTFNFPHFARRNQAPIIYTGVDSSVTDPPARVQIQPICVFIARSRIICLSIMGFRNIITRLNKLYSLHTEGVQDCGRHMHLPADNTGRQTYNGTERKSIH